MIQYPLSAAPSQCSQVRLSYQGDKKLLSFFPNFSWDIKSCLADLLSIWLLNAKHPVGKLFFDVLNFETFQMGSNFLVLFHFLSLNWPGCLVNVSIIGTTTSGTSMEIIGYT